MAYTYKDFETAANGAGVMNLFSQEDLGLAQKNPEFGLSMVKLQQDINSAKTTEQKLLAQEAQNQLRKVYGGMGTTAEGAAPSTTDVYGSTGSFTFSKQDQLDDLTNKVVNGGSFAYDPNNASAAAARKQYLREAERARVDTIAKAAAMSGGVPSSYAVSAAQQAGDYYVSQLADREADLEQTAYQRYLQEYQKNLSNLGVLTNERDFDYTAYLNQYQNEKEQFEGAMQLYETYGEKFGIEGMWKLYQSLGLTSPAIQTFLENMAAVKPTSSSSGPNVPKKKKQNEGTNLTQNEGTNLTHDEMVKEVNAYKQSAINAGMSPQQAQKNANLMAGEWYQEKGKYK